MNDEQTIVGWYTVYKFLDEDGDLAFHEESDGLRIPEIIGMLHLAIDRLTRNYWEND